jgi:hypothetical protein
VTYHFGPEQENAFNVARDELTTRFERTPAGRDLGWVAAGVMDFKWGYLDGALDRWTPEDIEEILLGLYPAKVIMDPEDLDLIPTGFASFLLFLGEEGIARPVEVGIAAEVVERLRPHFHAAAMDDTNWSVGKRLWSVAQSEGVEFGDPDAMQRFMEDFNQRPFEDRDAILGPPMMPAGLATPRDRIEPLPPIVLPPLDELEKAALATVWPERVRRLVDFIGDGRPLTDTGKLKLADGRMLIDILGTRDRFDPQYGDQVFKTRSTAHLSEVHLTFLIAVESNTLKRRGSRVLPGPNAGVLGDVLESFYGLWLTLFKRIGSMQYRYGGDTYGFGWYADELDESIPMVLLELYRRGPLSIDGLAADVWTHLFNTFDFDDVSDERLESECASVERALRTAFDYLDEFGSVEISGVTETPEKYGEIHRSGGSIALTPLGTWVMQRVASTVTSAPIVGALREMDADELLAAASDLPEIEAAAEIDAWVDHHEADAAMLLVETFRTADETGRGLTFQTLLRIGPDATEAVETLSDDPELDHYVTIWKVDTLAVDANMDCGEDPDRFVRLLGAVIEFWGPDAAVNAWASPAAQTGGLMAMLERVWRVDRPETELVLAAIGTVHPDRTIAKAARKSLFKHRSRD